MINYQINPKITWTFLGNSPNKLDRFAVTFKLENGNKIPKDCFTMIAQSANDLIEYTIEITTTSNIIETQEFSTSDYFYARGGLDFKDEQGLKRFDFWFDGSLEEIINCSERIASITSRADLFTLFSKNLKYNLWSQDSYGNKFTLNKDIYPQ